MTSGRVVELTLSSKGRPMMKVDNFSFYHEKVCRPSGLDLWRCINKLCTAKFYTNESYKVMEHEGNSFFHNHVLSRTKLVKRLVIKEIKKVAALRGSSMKTVDLIAYANKFLQQAFASTLDKNEMENVRKSVQDYCYYYRSQILANIPSSKRATADEISSESRRVQICKAAENGMLQDEESILLDSDFSDDDSGSNMTVKVENDTDGVQSTSGNQSALQISHDPLAYDCITVASPPTKKARFQPHSSVARSCTQNTTTPLLEPMPPVIHLTDGDMSYQRPFDSSKQRVDKEDDDDAFFRNILPLYRMLSQSDKSMIKAQIHQLVTWKLKNTM